jgi:quercetin dioxygenase-like cupin family protein
MKSKQNRVLENPVTGERITVLTTSQETEGRVHRHQLELPPGFSGAKQFHPYQQKCLKVTSGELRVWVDGLEHILGSDEDLVILPGTAHAWSNDGEASVIVTLRPALRSSELLATQVALAKEGKTDKHGLPTALHYAAFAQTFKNELVFALNPLQWAMQLAVTVQTFFKQRFYKRQEKTLTSSAKQRRPVTP